MSKSGGRSPPRAQTDGGEEQGATSYMSGVVDSLWMSSLAHNSPLDTYGFRYDLATGHHSPPGDTHAKCMLLLPPLGWKFISTGTQVLPGSGTVVS